jgi:hypothetical protein
MKALILFNSKDPVAEDMAYKLSRAKPGDVVPCSISELQTLTNGDVVILPEPKKND